MEPPKYAPGHAPSQVQHHAWRTAENSAAYLLPHLTQAVAQSPDLKVLDVGCGPGTISASLAKYLAPQGRLVATDIDDDILRRAAEHAEREGVAEKMAFQQADVYNLPFGDGEFDVVHAHQVLCHLENPVGAVREMLRVTKRGGIVALRESDMRMWCFWPEIEGLLKFHEMMVDVLIANGGQDKGGRKLVGWVLDAGVGRGDVDAGFGTWCYSKLEDRKAWGEAMIQRLQTGQMRGKGLELGITTEEDIDKMIKAWGKWIKMDEATLGIMNGEVIIHKSNSY